jgi:nucleotide-binding universal stress UspA family protein
VYGAGWAPAGPDFDEFRKLAESALQTSLEEAGAGEAGVTVTPILREGQPADVLCEEAAGADLLVVGSRGLGGFRGLLVGSVSQQCVHHSPCPVVVVPHRHEAREAAGS